MLSNLVGLTARYAQKSKLSCQKNHNDIYAMLAINRIEKILILCPKALTGGPEALHQLAGVLRAQGRDAQIMYYGSPANAVMRIDNGVLTSSHSTPEETPLPYRRYGVHVTDCCVLTPTVCVVLPEVLQTDVHPFAPAQVAVWWLSVDNAISSTPFTDPQQMRRWLQAVPLHLVQSMYAAAWLAKNGRPDSWMLSDFTDPDFTKQPSNLGERKRQVLFNPRKGGEAAHQLQKCLPDWEFLPLLNYSKSQLRQLMVQSRYYIDFGHHPGKDRLPREAAASGCLVLTRNAGAAHFFRDVPLQAHYKFMAAEVESGQLAQRLLQFDLQYEQHWNAQSRYRATILREREIFEMEVAIAFGP